MPPKRTSESFYGFIKAKLSTYWKWRGSWGEGADKSRMSNFIFSLPTFQFARHHCQPGTWILHIIEVSYNNNLLSLCMSPFLCLILQAWWNSHKRTSQYFCRHLWSLFLSKPWPTHRYLYSVYWYLRIQCGFVIVRVKFNLNLWRAFKEPIFLATALKRQSSIAGSL